MRFMVVTVGGFRIMLVVPFVMLTVTVMAVVSSGQVTTKIDFRLPSDPPASRENRLCDSGDRDHRDRRDDDSESREVRDGERQNYQNQQPTRERHVSPPGLSAVFVVHGQRPDPHFRADRPFS
jgi:hypothetical protein